MSPHRHEVLVVLGLAGSAWWSQLDPMKKALAALAIVALVAFSAGSMVSQLVTERSGALERLDRVERIAVRDSTRVENLEDAHLEQDADFERRLAALEARQAQVLETLARVDDRTRRMACMLAGNRGVNCL